MTITSSRCWALVPIKPPGRGKSRLASALDEADREALVDAMLRHVLDVALACPHIERVLVLGPGRARLDPLIEILADDGETLNGALESALARIAVRADAPDRLLILPADLPQVSAPDLSALTAVPCGSIAIAPDRHGSGTNALSLPLPEGAGWRFHFGTGSAALHRKEAQKQRLTAHSILRPGLEKDIDDPADLVDAGHLFSTAR